MIKAISGRRSRGSWGTAWASQGSRSFDQPGAKGGFSVGAATVGKEADCSRRSADLGRGGSAFDDSARPRAASVADGLSPAVERRPSKSLGLGVVAGQWNGAAIDGR
jgi:hypothetical protein